VLWFWASCTTPEAPPPAPTGAGGDLEAIRARGELRILVSEHARIEHLPRRGDPHDHEVHAARAFAAHLGLEAVVVQVPDHGDVVPWLLEGRGDLAVDSLTVTPALSERVRFSAPLGRVVEQVVGRPGPRWSGPADLEGHTVVVRRSSPFWDTVEALRREHPGIDLQPAPEHLDTEELVHEVATGQIELTVADDDLVQAILRYRAEDVAPRLDLGERRPTAWALRPDAEQLQAEVDRFLAAEELGQDADPTFVGDLPELRRRGVLRLLTHNSAATYFLHHGEVMGFELELWREFARSQDLRLQVVVPPPEVDLVDALVAGEGDLVAAGLTLTERRRADARVAWTAPYHESAEVLVAPAGRTLTGPEALSGQTVVVQRASGHWETVGGLLGEGIAVQVREAPPELEGEEILARVADGTWPLTVADRHLVDIELAHHLPIVAAFPLTEDRPHCAAVRAGDQELLAAVNEWIGATRGTTLYNLLRARYFGDPRKIAENTADRPTVTGALSPYDPLVRTVAERHGFDWRLVVSQMYQESRFDPAAKSWSGAVGLLQLKPTTAAELGFADVTEPAQGIEAGVTYLARMREGWGPLSNDERTWLALASYNAGRGHVEDARRLAEQQGLDPDRWFDHTEQALLLLARKEFAARARHGYVRAGEPVAYVRQVRERYLAYAEAVPDADLD
jgi:membrane-bound lytic murein transglycosylase F